MAEKSKNCQICERLYQKSPGVPAEVWHKKPQPGVWLCLNCYMAGQMAQQRGKGQVKEILQKCRGTDQCNSTPAWFCCDCYQYLCSDHKEKHDKQHDKQQGQRYVS